MLTPLCGTSLTVMSPKALLFSSDQETSLQLNQALSELGFEVHHCVEIFAAVERVTSDIYELIAADWDDGVEASFLLKTSRELKSNSAAFAVALAQPETLPAARRAGPGLVLTKPLLPGQIRHMFVSCGEFSTRFPQAETAAPVPSMAANPYSQLMPPAVPKGNPPSFLKTRPASPPSPQVTPVDEQDIVSISEPVQPGITPISGETLRRAAIQTLFTAEEVVSRPGKPRGRRFWRGSVYVFFVAAAGIFLNGPVRSGALTKSVSVMYQAARETTQSWLKSSPRAEAEPELKLASLPTETGLSYLPQRVTRIDVGRRHDPLAPPEVQISMDQIRPLDLLADIRQLPVMPQLQPSPNISYEGGIPASLLTSPLTPRDAALRSSPSLLSALEPVSVAEDMSERLLVQKILPVYPDQALRTGLQGTVVLQALIGKDGMVRDLKLIRGSLLLGQAAFEAVRQWRYQPYFVNGHAVDAQTFVTVDFKLPAVAQAAQPQP